MKMSITSLLIGIFLIKMGVCQGCQWSDQQCNKTDELLQNTDELLQKIDAISVEQFEISKQIADLQYKNLILVENFETKLIEKLNKFEERLSERLAEIETDTETMRHNLLEESNCKQLLANCNSEQKGQTIQNNYNQYHQKQFPTDCSQINGGSGVYSIQPQAARKPFLAWCDMDTWGGSWTVLLHRFNGLQNFNLKWIDYEHGFGNLESEFWLGLMHIFELTSSQDMELLFEIVQWDLSKYYANYKVFKIGDDSEKYYLKAIGDYAGNAGDAFGAHLGFRFQTPDQDDTPIKCSVNAGGGWWYKDCYHCKFTGAYLKQEHLSDNVAGTGMHWLPLGGLQNNLKEVKMMIRPLRL